MKECKVYSSVYSSISNWIRKKVQSRTLLIFVFACVLGLSVFSISGGEALFDPLFDSLYAGRNVNMVSFDPHFQRQNEPSIAVSTLHPRTLLGGSNDYTTVAYVGDPEEEVTGDAWLGVYKSFDGGESWTHDLLPPYDNILDPNTPSTPNPVLTGFDAAADPTVRAGLDGMFYYSGIAFDREENGDSVVFVARFQDVGSDIDYLGTAIIDTGTSGQFSDKPWNVVDIPRNGYSEGIIYCIYSVFLGQIDHNVHSKILISRSLDSGVTWSKPIKVSESVQVNQGTTVAIDPEDGTVYIAWRRFADSNSSHGIMIAKSEDFGQTFTKAVEVASITRPFDQATIGGYETSQRQFRTNVYPAMAIDDTSDIGRIYIVWSQRDVDSGSYVDDARIVITSQAKNQWGGSWDPAVPVDSNTITHEGNVKLHSHQFMPSLTFASGKLMLAWFDNRHSARIIDEFGYLRNDGNCGPGESGSTPEEQADRIVDFADSCNWRETIDVRAAVANPSVAGHPIFGDSIQVSRYIWVLWDNMDGTYKPMQAQFNAPNYPLFSGGTAPFHGDYLDVIGSPMFFKEGVNWRYSQEGDPFKYYVSWTDNRDVYPAPGGLWELYDPLTCLNGTRNQNIYVSKLTGGIEIGVENNFKAPSPDGRSFVVNVNNTTADFREIKLELFDNPIPIEPSSFSNESYEKTIKVTIPPYSGISRMIFVYADGIQDTEVKLTELSGLLFTDTITLYTVGSQQPGGENHLPSITQTQIINWTNFSAGGELVNPNVLSPNVLSTDPTNPNVLSPNVLSPNVLSPNVLSPNVLSPNVLSPNVLSPNVLSVTYTNPNVLSTSILNPNVLSPNVLSVPVKDTTEIVEKIWTVENLTDSETSYTFKSIAGETLPFGIYTQLLIFRLHNVPATNGDDCDRVGAQHELLVNAVPNIITDIDPAKIKDYTSDPYQNPFEKTAFSLRAWEKALIVLRFIDTKEPPPPPPQGGGMTVSTMRTQSDPSSLAEEVGAIIVSHNSTEQNEVNAITKLMIGPAAPVTLEAGDYYEKSFVAIGGAGDYIWSLDVDNRPQGMFWDLTPDNPEDYVHIYGTPKEIGTFTSLLKVTDSEGKWDTQSFTVIVTGPAQPLQIIMTPSVDTYATKNKVYSGPIFEATGGVPFIDAPNFEWTLSGDPNDSMELADISDGAGTKVQLVGTAIETGYFLVTISVFDDLITSAEGPVRPVTKTFDLCVWHDPDEFLSIAVTSTLGPINCDINTCSLPDGELGSDYGANGITLAPLNNEPNTAFTLAIKPGSDNLPSGLEFFPSIDGGVSLGAGPLSIVGTPVFDGNHDYSQPYSITLVLKESYMYQKPDSSWSCGWERTAEKTLEIDINVKEAVWISPQNSHEGAAKTVASAKGENGFIYVTGYIDVAGEGRNYYTAKYDTNPGSQNILVWEKTYDGPAHGFDEPSAIAVDDSGVYVTGKSENTNTGDDILTIKYDFDGNEDLNWPARYDGPSHLGDGANAMALSGNYLFIGGYVHRGNVTKHADFVVVKYDKLSGEELWDETYDSTRNGNDIITALAADKPGNVYVTGKSQESDKKLDTSHDFLTLKYNDSGVLLWEARDDGPGFGDDEPTAIALWENPSSPDDVHVYVTGLTGSGIGAAYTTDYYTVKYDADGNPLWANGMAYGKVNGNDASYSIDLDSDENVYITGNSAGSIGPIFATVKYNKDGVFKWATTGDGGMFGDKSGSISVISESGKLFVAGYMAASGNADFMVLNLDPESGDIIGLGQFRVPDITDPADNFVTSIALDATAIYVTGYIQNTGPSGVVTVKFNK